MNYFEIGFSKKKKKKVKQCNELLWNRLLKKKKKKKKTLKAHGSMHLLSYGCVRTRIDIVILNPIDL